MKIERNQLAEIIVSDGQPARALINYLQDAMEQLKDFDCITDYYKETDVHPLLNGTPNLKMNNSFFLDFLAMAYGQLREINEKPLKLEDLYMVYNWDNDGSDDDYPIGQGYVLSANEEDAFENIDFLIVFNDEKTKPIICNINVDYYGVKPNRLHESIKYKKTKGENITLYSSELDGDLDYKEDEIRFIIPLSKVAY